MGEEAKASLRAKVRGWLAATIEQKRYWSTLLGTLGAVSVAGGVSIAFALPNPRLGLGATGVVCGIILAVVGAGFLRQHGVSKEADR